MGWHGASELLLQRGDRDLSGLLANMTVPFPGECSETEVSGEFLLSSQRFRSGQLPSVPACSLWLGVRWMDVSFGEVAIVT